MKMKILTLTLFSILMVTKLEAADQFEPTATGEPQKKPTYSKLLEMKKKAAEEKANLTSDSTKAGTQSPLPNSSPNKTPYLVLKDSSEALVRKEVVSVTEAAPTDVISNTAVVANASKSPTPNNAGTESASGSSTPTKSGNWLSNWWYGK